MKKSPKEMLVGAWMQVSLDTVTSNGTRRPLYGENAKGMIIYTADGYFTLMQASVDLPKLKSGLPSKATPTFRPVLGTTAPPPLASEMRDCARDGVSS